MARTAVQPLLRESRILGVTFDDFLQRALKANNVSSENARRLLSVLPYGIAQATVRQLDRAAQEERMVRPIAACLRTVMDFADIEEVRFRPPNKYAHWCDAVIKDQPRNDDEEVLVSSESSKVAYLTQPTYVGLYSVEDYQRLYSERPGSGKPQSMAHFAIRMSYFVPDEEDFELLGSIGRHFGLATIHIPPSDILGG